MRISDRTCLTTLIGAVALLAAVPAMAAQALPALANGGKPVVTAAAAAPAGTTLDAAAPALEAVAVPAVSRSASGAASAPAAETPDTWFALGLQAYNAGDGRLAVEHWRKAADTGHLPAQWNLSILFRRGGLVERDIAESIRHLRAVAARHDPNRRPGAHSAMTVAALVEFADITRAGEPAAKIQPDPARAARMYEIAATLYGDARAQHRLGMMYLKGEGVSHHAGRALRWLALSARKRYVPSFAALGDFYWQNRSEGNNKVRGLMWLSLAKENVKRDDLRAAVTDRYNAALTEANEEERQKAMALIQTWNSSAE